jgi:DNA-directed RNA polymerase omega subunit
MPVKAFPFDRIEGKVQNVYEAVIIAAKRARQINDDQMVQVRTLTEGTEVNETEETEINREDLVDLDKLPKPVVQALNELVANSIEYEYIEQEDE